MTRFVLPPKTAGGDESFLVDFSPYLEAGVTIVSAACVATVFSGVDPAPQAIVRAISFVAAGQVTVVLTGGVIGNVYALDVSSMLSGPAPFNGNVIDQTGFVAVISNVPNPPGAPIAENITLLDLLATTNGASLIGWIALYPGAVPRSVEDKLRDYATSQDFGAVGDGVADDYAALNYMIQSRVRVQMAVGNFRYTQGLVFIPGARLIGAGNWNAATSDDKYTGTTVLTYDGPSGTNTCAVRLSNVGVGVDPIAAGAAGALQNITLCDITIDAGGADIGLYMVRAWTMNQLERITVCGSAKHGFLAIDCWDGSPRDWMAAYTQGNGISLGPNPFGWSSGTIDESVCENFLAFRCNCDSAGNPLGTFDGTNPDQSYGIGIFGSRGVSFHDMQSGLCAGVGLYMNPTFGSVEIHEGYHEGNGRSPNNAGQTQYDIWFRGVGTGASNNVIFNSVWLGLTPVVKMDGTQPSRRAGRVQFWNMINLPTIDSSFSRFETIDCDVTTYLNARPEFFQGSINGALNLQTTGVCVFLANTGAINTLLISGTIASVSYTAVGTYHVTLAETYSSARYEIELDSCDGVVAAPDFASITTSGFDILHRNALTGVLTDTASRISVRVGAYYT